VTDEELVQTLGLVGKIDRWVRIEAAAILLVRDCHPRMLLPGDQLMDRIAALADALALEGTVPPSSSPPPGGAPTS